ncbi:MAG: VOC family protein [Pseudomonadota bacterium]|nr:VOC family protein [Pseudomonadota bacterium]
MLTGINHVTITVSDLDASFEFYVSILGMKPKLRWREGAYLSAGSLWFCLSSGVASPAEGYSHMSFSISRSDFSIFKDKLRNLGIKEWKVNASEGESLYILDPDGHKLEIHVGSLETRLSDIKSKPYDGAVWY